MAELRQKNVSEVCACNRYACVCVMCIGPYCTFDWMKSNDQIDVTLIAFIINDHTFSLPHSLSHQCIAGYHLPKSKQKTIRFENLHQNFEHRLKSYRIVSQPVDNPFYQFEVFSRQRYEHNYLLVISVWVFVILVSFGPFSVFGFVVCSTHTHTDAHKHFLCSSIADSVTSLDQFDYGQLFYLVEIYNSK